MKRLIAPLTVAGLCLVGLAGRVYASSLSFGDVYSLGTVDPGSPSSATDEAGYINTLIAQPAPSGPTTVSGHVYTRTSNAFGSLPTAVVTGSVSDTSGSFTGIDLTGYSYLLAKYGDTDYVWFVGGLSGSYDIPGTSYPWAVNPAGKGYGISHYTLFNPSSVPDAGATLALLGLGLLGIAGLRRRLARS